MASPFGTFLKVIGKGARKLPVVGPVAGALAGPLLAREPVGQQEDAYLQAQKQNAAGNISSPFDAFNRAAGLSQQLNGLVPPQIPGGGLFGGSGGGLFDPNLDLGIINPLRNQLTDAINKANGIYSGLYGKIDALAGDRVHQLQDTYNPQFSDLQSAFEKSQSQLPGAYAARGLGSSSYFDQALSDSAKTYQDQVNQLTQAQQGDLAKVGQFASTAKAGYQANQGMLGGIHPGSYLTASSLQQVLGDVNNQIANLQGNVLPGLGTNSEYLNQLNSISPYQQTGTQDLAKQLQSLVTSSAPYFAKNAIAQGLLKRNQVTDENSINYWSDYFQKLLSGQSATPQIG